MFGEALQKKLAEAMEQQVINSLFGNINPGMAVPGPGRGMQQQQPPRNKTCFDCGNPGHYKNDPSCPIVLERQQKSVAYDKLMQQQQLHPAMYPNLHQVQQVQATPLPPPPPVPPQPPPPQPELEKKLDTVINQVQQLTNAFAADRLTLRRAEQSQAAFEGTTAIALKEVTVKLAEVTSELQRLKMVQVHHAQSLSKIENRLGTSWEAVLRDLEAKQKKGRRAPASAPPARRAKTSRDSVETVDVSAGGTDEEDDADSADRILHDLGEGDEGEGEETPATGASRRAPSSRRPSQRSR
jgi:hypothetical protein